MSTDYKKIEKAIDYLQESFQDQPSLNQLAEHLNMSPYHFQRLFKHWAGISPKRFLQFLTIEHAKKLLNENRNLLDVTYESGLSSPGRLHDLFVKVDAVTPGEFKSKGTGIEISYGFHPSPFGECLLAATERGVCRLSFLSRDKGRQEAVADLQGQWQEARLKENRQITKPLIARIFRPAPHANGSSISLFLKGTNFQLKVWEALLRIPPGRICSYEDVANYLGKPTAARAVGSAVAANPVVFIIPCHRVIRKMGVFGNYRHGTSRKKAMIGWEVAQRYRREVKL